MKRENLTEEEIKRVIYRLRKERQLVETYLLNTGKQLAVWITRQYTYCKKGNCKCLRGYPHGPFYYLFYQEGDNICHRYLPEEKLKQIEKFTHCYKVYNQQMARMNKINEEIERHLRIHQRNNLLPIPGLIREKKRK